MKKYWNYIALAAAFLCAVLLFCLKTTPQSHLWKDYNVLYVPSETDENEVLDVLEDCKINEVISLNGQYYPVNLKTNSPEYSMLLIGVSSTGDYIQKRNLYFFDKSGKYKLFYIPKKYSSNLNDVLSVLSLKKIKGGIDIFSSYPWIVPLVSLAFAVLLMLYSKNKIPFITGTLFELLFVLNNPFYNSGICSILTVFALFIFTNLLFRKGAKEVLAKNYYLPAFILVSIFAAFGASISCGFLYLVSLSGLFSSTFLCIRLIKEQNSKKSFQYLLINPANKVSIYANKQKIILPVSIFLALLLFLINIIGFRTNKVSISDKLLLPYSTTQKNADANLAQLENYYEWVWNVKTFPYKSINKTQNEDYVEYPTYENDNGIIKESSKIMVYNDSFKNNVYKEIDDISFESIEKLFKSEGTGFKGGYSGISNYKSNPFSMIMIFTGFCILLFLYISIIIKEGDKK